MSMSAQPAVPANFDRLAASLGLSLRDDAYAGQVRGQRVILTWKDAGTDSRPHRPESVHIGFERELDLGLSVRRKPAAAGGAGFDQSVEIESDEPSRLGAVLTPAVLSGWKLLETTIPQGVQWGINDSSLYLSEGASGMPASLLRQVIDTALESIALLLDGCSRIPVPSPLQRHLEVWGAFGRAQDMSCLRAPLRMNGLMDHFHVRARTLRTGPLEFRSELVIAFPRSLGHELLVEPQSSIDVPGEWNDATLGDEAFDKAFRLNARDPGSARRLFDREARQALIELAAEVANFEINDQRISIWPAFALEPAGKVPQLLMLATELAARILRGFEGRPGGNIYR